MQEEDIHTGDLLLCSSDSPVGLVIRFFTVSDWTHVAIAIRIDKNGKVSLNEGDLYVYEMMASVVKNPDGTQTSVSIKPFEEFKKSYTTITVRPIKDSLRTEQFRKNIVNFIPKHRNYTWSRRIMALFSIMM